MGFFGLSTTGTTRLVVCAGPYAIKLARGATGRRCNLYEASLWRDSTPESREILCPVLLAMPFGVAIVMPRADPISETEARDYKAKGAFPDWDHHPPADGIALFEYSAGDWGWLDDHLVALDYSAPAVPHD